MPQTLKFREVSLFMVHIKIISCTLDEKLTMQSLKKEERTPLPLFLCTCGTLVHAFDNQPFTNTISFLSVVFMKDSDIARWFKLVEDAKRGQHSAQDCCHCWVWGWSDVCSLTPGRWEAALRLPRLPGPNRTTISSCQGPPREDCYGSNYSGIFLGLGLTSPNERLNPGLIPSYQNNRISQS